MTLPLGEDPIRGREPRHEVVTTTTFKTVDDSGASGLITSALEANGKFSKVSVEYVNQGRPQQYRLFTAHRTLRDLTDPTVGVTVSTTDVVDTLENTGVKVQIVQVYGRLVTYGKL